MELEKELWSGDRLMDKEIRNLFGRVLLLGCHYFLNTVTGYSCLLIYSGILPKDYFVRPMIILLREK